MKKNRPTSRELMSIATARCDSACLSPDGRYRLRERFYAKFGFGVPGTFGFGRAELDFLGWEIARGVLGNVEVGRRAGSPWWRAVNRHLLLKSEIAASFFENGVRAASDPDVRLWIEYLHEPSAVHWYRAHNRSIVSAYVEHAREAMHEPPSERLFLGVLLSRLLAMQLLNEGALFSANGRLLAHPKLPLVGMLVQLPNFYPRHYPLTADDPKRFFAPWSDPPSTIPLSSHNTLDRLIVANLQEVYETAGNLLGLPALPTFLNDGRLAYPCDVRVGDMSAIAGTPPPLNPSHPADAQTQQVRPIRRERAHPFFDAAVRDELGVPIGRLADIHDTGMLLVHDASYRPRSEMHVSILASRELGFSALALPVRHAWTHTDDVGGGRSGFEFSALAPEQALSLRDFLARFTVEGGSAGTESSATAQSGSKRRIAILGGGPAALAVAWELTSYPDWNVHYDVTIYTLGWRLGGKIATGRGPNNRVEEHGLHILQGWYHNTFRLFRDVFDERRARALDRLAPYQSLDDALVRENSTLMTDWNAETQTWDAWQLELPANHFAPGLGGPLPPGELAMKGFKVLVAAVVGGPRQGDSWPRRKVLERIFAQPMPSATRGTPNDFTATRPRINRRLLGIAQRLAKLGAATPAGTRARGFSRLGFRTARGRRRRLALFAELAEVITRGILLDVYNAEHHLFDFQAINDLDFRDWLRQHGAGEAVLTSSLVRFAYTGTFSDMTEGDHGRLAAGTALEIGLMAMGYKGSFVWKLRAGTADTLLTPLYQVLQTRGVRFEFFHRVEQLHDSDTGAIEKISVARQARVSGGHPYEPLVASGDLLVWPSRPRYDELEPGDAEALQQGDVDLESPWSGWRDVETMELQRGRDFDEVVLAIPVAALREICSEIAASRPRFHQMVHGIRTTQTQSAQLWLRPALHDLGVDRTRLGMRSDAAPNLVTYANPIYSWLDLSMLIPLEQWGPNAPLTCAYFTGPLPDAQPIEPYQQHDFPQKEHQRVMHTVASWLDSHIGFLWPKAMRSGHFDRGLLAAARDDATAEERFEAQFFKANIEPSARYTLAYPGTHRHRLRTDASGFTNLWLAGDWVDYGLNAGYIEGAITSGLQAAQSLRRRAGLPSSTARYVNLDITARRSPPTPTR